MSRTRRIVTRTALVLLGLEPLANQIPAYIAPGAFYDVLPGRQGAAPADTLHLLFIRDMASGRIALSVLMLLAAYWLDPRLVRVAFVTFFVASALRLTNHLLADAGDTWINWIGFSIAVALPAVMLALDFLDSRRRET